MSSAMKCVMSSIISTYTPGQIFVSIHFWEPPPCVQILALKVPLGSVHFSPFPRVTFLVEAASISHLGLLPFHNGLPAPTPPPPHHSIPHTVASVSFSHGDCDHVLMTLIRSWHVPSVVLPLPWEWTPKSIPRSPPFQFMLLFLPSHWAPNT